MLPEAEPGPTVVVCEDDEPTLELLCANLEADEFRALPAPCAADALRLCHFNQCPKHKPQCRAEGCGTVPFLQQHDGFVFDGGESLHASRVQILYERQAEKGAVLDKIPF